MHFPRPSPALNMAFTMDLRPLYITDCFDMVFYRIGGYNRREARSAFHDQPHTKEIFI
jgi:hypothetical protein